MHLKVIIACKVMDLSLILTKKIKISTIDLANFNYKIKINQKH